MTMSKQTSDLINGILDREGPYTNHPSDPGGPTRYGITQKVARAYGFKGDMRYLPKSLAIEIYFKQYIQGPKFDGIMDRDPVIGEEVVDSGVNAGQDRSAKWFQLALNVFNRRGVDYPDVTVDGDIGPMTLAAYDALVRKRGKAGARKLMMRMLNGLQIAHYYSLADGNTKFEDFMPGWVLNRISDL